MLRRRVRAEHYFRAPEGVDEKVSDRRMQWSSKIDHPAPKAINPKTLAGRNRISIDMDDCRPRGPRIMVLR